MIHYYNDYEDLNVILVHGFQTQVYMYDHKHHWQEINKRNNIHFLIIVLTVSIQDDGFSRYSGGSRTHKHVPVSDDDTLLSGKPQQPYTEHISGAQV